MILIEFVIQGEPTSKARPRVVDGRAYTPERTASAEAQVQAAYLGCGNRLTLKSFESGARYSVTMLFACQTRQRRDIDNMVKLILDALNGVAWTDDAQVTEIHASKVLVPVGRARTDVVIAELPPDPGLTAVCGWCGEEFRTYPSLVHAVRYCSAECRTACVAAKAVRTCEQCGLSFASKWPRRFCGSDCQRLGNRVVQPCAECGADVERFKSWSKNGRPFCGVDCRAAFWRDHRKIHNRGQCQTCGGPTSKRCYTRCHACKVAAEAKA